MWVYEFGSSGFSNPDVHRIEARGETVLRCQPHLIGNGLVWRSLGTKMRLSSCMRWWQVTLHNHYRDPHDKEWKFITAEKQNSRKHACHIYIGALEYRGTLGFKYAQRLRDLQAELRNHPSVIK